MKKYKKKIKNKKSIKKYRIWKWIY
jgi:hypothetical protein